MPYFLLLLIFTPKIILEVLRVIRLFLHSKEMQKYSADDQSF